MVCACVEGGRGLLCVEWQHRMCSLEDGGGLLCVSLEGYIVNIWIAMIPPSPPHYNSVTTVRCVCMCMCVHCLQTWCIGACVPHAAHAMCTLYVNESRSSR